MKTADVLHARTGEIASEKGACKSEQQTVHAVLSSRRRTGCLREHSGDKRLRLPADVSRMLAVAEPFPRPACTPFSLPDRRTASHSSSVTTFSPAIDAAIPGTVVRIGRIVSHASFTSTVHQLVDDVGAFRQVIADCFIARPFGRQVRSGAVDEA
jgi:hypothetical protein